MSDNKEHGEPLYWIRSKGKNKRIEIVLYDFGDQKAFRLYTKTLISFKDREILVTDNLYSIETFKLINEISNHFFENSKIANKVILRELNDIKKWEARGNFK
jgi:hypothetical protein